MAGTYFLAGVDGASDIRLSPFVTDRILVASGASGSAGNAFGAPGGYTHGWHPTRGKSHGYTESVYTTQSSGCSIIIILCTLFQSNIKKFKRWIKRNIKIQC